MRPIASPLPLLAALAALAALAVPVACVPGDDAPTDRQRVLLVTTTTVEDSGLLDQLVTAYHAAQDRYHLSTTAVGSGAALAIGRRGDADVLLTHDPHGEARFMAEAHGEEQGLVMVNEFVLVGPPSDPAGIRGATDLADALERIAATGATFVSRGDDSGTHRRERALWRETGLAPQAERPEWYLEAGAGMAEALRIADQRRAYTLTDRSTFRHLSPRLELERLARGDPPELNPYTYTLPSAPPHLAGARDFLDWLMGPGQETIGSYGRERFGKSLFRPAAATAAY